jgi:hypothetical protein
MVGPGDLSAIRLLTSAIEIQPRYNSQTMFPLARTWTQRILMLPLWLYLSGTCNGIPQFSPTLSIRIHGDVRRSKKFEAEIGQGLVFRLVPGEYGWTVEVGPKDSNDDYMDCVNGPHHGITLYHIEGWQFRNDDNTALLKASELKTPGVGEKREFQFVLTSTDESKACAELEKMESKPDERLAGIATTNRFDTYAGGNGSLIITSMTLGNLKPGSHAWIETMSFDAIFSFRSPAGKHRR